MSGAEMIQVWIIFSVISNVWCVRFSYGSVGIHEFFENKDNHAASSCEWKDPPENAHTYIRCARGDCEVTPGIFSKNGTIRTTRCDPHYTLIQGYERDVCNDGEWSSIGHECVQCGKSPRTFNGNDKAALIVGGSYSLPGDFPWMAALFLSIQGDPWSISCGGTLISPHIVLTAAHCLDNNGRRTKPAEVKVGLGRLYLNYSISEPGSVMASVKDILIHEKYVGQNRQYDVDIALIVLEDRVQINNFIMPACIDWNGINKPTHNDNGVLAGWGVTEDNFQSNSLKWTYQKYINYQQCRNMMSSSDYAFLSPDKFCADEVRGGTADHGDSGGGLTFVRNGIHYVYGIVSTKMLTNAKQLRLFTNLMNEVHRTWLSEEWRKLQEQLYQVPRASSSSGGKECTKDGECPDNKRCVGQTCLDLCPTACGTNTVCRMANHLPVCSCKPGYNGNPFDSCTKGEKTDLPQSAECLWFDGEAPSAARSCSLNQRKPGTLVTVQREDFPYLGIIADENLQNRHYGVLISDRWFLSTASCYSSESCNKKVKLGISEGEIRDTPRMPEYDVIEEYLHPGYQSYSIDNIGLFKLDRVVRLTQFIWPACLVPATQSAGTEGVVVGKMNNTLMKTTTDILPENQCRGTTTATFKDSSMLCVNVYRSKSSLRMYAGLPLIGPINKPYCTHGLLGLATFGKTGEPEGYMRLSYYLPWIENILRIAQSQSKY